jgi:hypothetical protein
VLEGFWIRHHSRTLFCRAVPNPNLTIRDFFHRRTRADAPGVCVHTAAAFVSTLQPALSWAASNGVWAVNRSLVRAFASPPPSLCPPPERERGNLVGSLVREHAAARAELGRVQRRVGRQPLAGARVRFPSSLALSTPPREREREPGGLPG